MSDSAIYPTGCPIDVQAKRWLEQRLEWLVENLGPGFFERGFVLVLPTRDQFPVSFDGSPVALAFLFERICARMDLSPSEFTVTIQSAPEPQLRIVDEEDHAVPLGNAGSFAPHEAGAHITVNAEQLHHPADLVTTIAHELSHFILHRLDPSRKLELDRELLTDLIAIHFGFGVFAANSPRDWYSDYGLWPGTDLRMPRYVPGTMSSYALALASVVRGDHSDAWLEHLIQDASTNARAALRYLHSTHDVPPSLLAAIERASKPPEPGNVDGAVTVIDERIAAVTPRKTIRAKGRIRMKGLWRGSYSFDSPSAAARENSFTMKLRDGWFGNFRGTSLEDPPGPTEESTVEGRINGASVTWTKSYDHYWVAAPGGAILYEEYLRAQKQIEVDDKIEGFDVEYDGAYDEERQVFEGTWRIVSFERAFTAGGETHHLPAGPGATGRWTMRRVENR